MALIFWFSHQPDTVSDVQSGVIVNALRPVVGGTTELLTFTTRKGAHIVAYAVLGALLVNALRYMSLRRWRMVVLVAVLCAGLYAATDEIHQTFIPGRSGEARDVLIDTVAAAGGAVIAAAALRRNSRG